MKNKVSKFILTVLLLLAVFIWTEIVKSPSGSDNNCHIFFLNVGQGDSELIQKGDYQILIDGGPDDKVLSELGKAMPVSDRKIDVLILTHPHADHLTGINQILDRYEIGKIYTTGVIFTSNGYLEFLDKVNSPAGGKKIDLEVPDLEEKFTPFENGELTFLWPGKKFEQKSAEDNNLNNTSEVARFCYFDHCTLFTGDIQIDEQATMFNYYNCHSEANAEESQRSFASAQEDTCNIFQSEILKIPHHGSNNGTDQTLLDFVKPKTAIIEVGVDNKFGHPHTATLDLLQNANIRYYRTDRDGTIEFVINQDGTMRK